MFAGTDTARRSRPAAVRRGPHRTRHPRPGRLLLAAVASLVVIASGGPAGALDAAAASTAAPSAAGHTTGTSSPPTTHTVSYDHYSLLLDGRRIYLWSAEFHYWRLPSPDLWRDVLQKMKAAGFNATSIYFDWGFHSPEPGVYDFRGIRDVDTLLTIAQQEGIFVIARPGPYINAETDSGGFPGWLTTQQGRARSSAADFQAASDEWLSQIDPIIARHQYTNGTGSVILYQIENEYGNNTDAAYMDHTEKLVRSHGITVPFTHNHCCGASTWATGTGAVDLPGQDSYPQGFNCSTPARWNPVATLPRFRDDAPIFTPEFQGGSFDPWGGPGYEACRQLTGADFERVFYTNNVAAGATLQNLYMGYGGTSWGWLPDPNQVYTSYDYGAPISEQRGLGAKYDEVHRLGYLFGALAPLTKTDPAASTAPDNGAVREQLRLNPDDGTQFLVLRHADSTSTATSSTHVSIDLGARSTYSYDDPDAALHYSGNWSHVGAEQNYTGGDYRQTESFSNTAGDAMTVTFTGTAVRWISSYDANHGIVDVYLDGTKVATVDGYGTPKTNQQVFYSADGLGNGSHTLKLVVTGTKNPRASGTYGVVDAIDVPAAGAVRYATVPQQPGTAITLAGRDAKLLVANYAMGSQRLVYSTSQILTHATMDGRDIAVLYGRDGGDGETVLRYDAQPTVRVADGGHVASTWDAARGDLRLNYAHSGTTTVDIDGTVQGRRARLRLYLTTDAGAATWWREDTPAGTVLVQGPELVRTATVHGSRLDLTGDTSERTAITVLAPASLRSVRWNGASCPVLFGRRPDRPATSQAALTTSAPGPVDVRLPALTSWRYTTDTPEAQPGFDDSGWTVADKLTSNSITAPGSLPVLFADDYGFHHGDLWYRGHFAAAGTETGLVLSAITGPAGVYSVWLNGHYLGSHSSGTATFPIPAGTLESGASATVSVLVENMGHNEDFSATDSHKQARGLTAARILGSGATLTWRIQGNRGGEDLIDPVRGPFNNGGLHGERQGYSLPGYPDRSWTRVSAPRTDTTPGVGWYRTTFRLHLPRNQDTSLGLTITDDAAKHYRAQIFLNGWLIGRYINDVGPQHTFALPNGILRTDGQNTLAIASWGTDEGSGPSLGTVTLTKYFAARGGVQVAAVRAPAYRARTYATAPAAGRLALAGPDTTLPGAESDVRATFTVPATAGDARDVTLSLPAPDGWTATATTPTRFASVRRGATVSATFHVTAPPADLAAYTVLRAAATFRPTRGRGHPRGPSATVTAALGILAARAQSTDPVAHWTFDEGSGTTAADSSGGDHPATLVGSGAGWAAGTQGSSSLALSGNSYAEVGTAVVNTADDFSVSAWVKFAGTSGYQTVVSIDGNQVSGFYLQLRGDTGKFSLTRLTADSTSATTVTAQAVTTSPATGTWYHLVGVQDATAGRILLYVNGILQDSVPYTSPWTAGGKTAIGRGLYGGNRVDFVQGQIDDVQVFDRALSASDVAALAGTTATAPTITVNASGPTTTVSPTLFGTFFEDINHSGEGGIYAELLQNRSMMADASAPLHWSTVASGSGTGSIALDPAVPLNSALTRSLRLDVTSAGPGGRVGVANDGFWGVPARPATAYTASFYAKASDGFTGPLTVGIEGPTGQVLASGTVPAVTGSWAKYTLTLTTSAGIPVSGNNRFVISTTAAAASGRSLWLDQVSLFPPTYADRPNGLRTDLAQKLHDLDASFLRFPGGNYLEGNTIDTRFNWKNTIGPVETRPGHQNDAWGYWSTDGLGLLEYLEWAEDLGQQPLLAVYAGYSLHGAHVPADELGPYVQDALDEIEYATGPVTSTWGAKRAADGHPQPFALDYVEIGNEDWLDASGSYDSRYAAFYDAIHAEYPDLKLIATTTVTSRPVDVYDEHFYRSSNWMNSHADYYDTRSRSGPDVFVGEWATREGSPTPNMAAALGDASWLTGLIRNSDVVVMESYAPLFVNVHDVRWAVDLIGYDNTTSYGSPSYYVQQTLAKHHGNEVLPTTVSAWSGLNTVTTRDSATGAVYLTVVNPTGVARDVHVAVDGATVQATGTATVLAAGSPTDTNTLADPTAIVPVSHAVSGLSGSFDHTFPPYSMTVLQVGTS